MRLWSIHPQYLDAKGLVALWREGLLARKVLLGKTKGYTNHPQLLRFKKTCNPITAIDAYLEAVANEAAERKYSFDKSKVKLGQKTSKIPVTDSQIAHEFKHLQSKLKTRDPGRLKALPHKNIAAHPLFKIIPGRIEQWERVNDNLNSFPYDLNFSKTNFRKNPELYKVGKGEQGVLMVEPYKSEILPHWRFKTPQLAEASAKKIYSLFLNYKKQKDFVGMDMARKYLQMGFTRSRRYANHPTGRKYVSGTNKILSQATDWRTNEKAESARIFYKYYEKAKNNKLYLSLKKNHQANK